MNDLFQGVKSLVLLERSLDLRAQKHLQIISNVANSMDPDYQAFEVVLDGALKDLDGDGSKVVLAATNEHHLTPANHGAQGVEYRPRVMKMEEEMARLTENHLKYNASVELMNRKLRLIRLAVMDRA